MAFRRDFICTEHWKELYTPFSFLRYSLDAFFHSSGSRHFSRRLGIKNKKKTDASCAAAAACDPCFMPDPAVPADSHRTNKTINSQLRRAVSSPRTKTLPGQEDNAGGNVIALNRWTRRKGLAVKRICLRIFSFETFQGPLIRALRNFAKIYRFTLSLYASL